MKQLWFKAKHYGWGWYPVTWQGWLAIIVYVALMLGTGQLIDAGSDSVNSTLLVVTPLWIVYTLLLLVICYKTGETPRWRWGKD